VLADVDAKILILGVYERALSMPGGGPRHQTADGLAVAVRALAQPYREHPQFHTARRE
jgi:hypothetical protein